MLRQSTMPFTLTTPTTIEEVGRGDPAEQVILGIGNTDTTRVSDVVGCCVNDSQRRSQQMHKRQKSPPGETAKRKGPKWSGTSFYAGHERAGQ